jgi:hypothetical protein
MNINNLQAALEEIKCAINNAITSASYQGKSFHNGCDAKNALIRSATLIQRIHEVTKDSLHRALSNANIPHSIFPPIGRPSPEHDVWGLLKKKKQDVVAMHERYCASRETILDGPLSGTIDELGHSATNHSIVLGVRSQLSSVDKNFDTLMERAFAETLNLRLRNPDLVMGEVYLIPICEYDDAAMGHNRVEWKRSHINVSKFISLFDAISGRTVNSSPNEAYKYERSVLIIADFSQTPIKLYTRANELVEANLVSTDTALKYNHLSPVNFGNEIVQKYIERHPDAINE